MTDQDKALVKAAAEQLCRKGAHNPDEAATLFNFCQFAARILKDEKPIEEKKPESKGK